MDTVRDEDALWLAAITAVVFLIYGYHFYRAARLHVKERSMRSFRNLFIAIMLQLGFLRIFIGSLSRAMPTLPGLVGVQLVVAPLLTLMLLSGGVVLWWTWRSDDR